MRVLLDECLPRKLREDLPGHEVSTVPEMGWRGVKNGVLLRLAEASFDVFVTADQGIEYQRSLVSTRLAIVILVALNNRLATLRPLMPGVLIALPNALPGDVVRISE